MAKVLYKQGTKATYLGLLERSPSALYFCTDTHELFKGDDLYSDGLRFVSDYNMLPDFSEAADGVLYFCINSGCGYVLGENRNAWITVIHGVDNDTIGFSADGLLCVKSVPLSSVLGLAELLEKIESVSIATSEKTGLVKGSTEISVAGDGSMSITAIAQSKVLGLEKRLVEIERSILGGGFGGTDTASLSIEDVCTIAKPVDYEVFSKPDSTLVNYSDGEVRIMCASDTEWTHQNSGVNSNPNMYYIGLKAYAPSNDVVSFKEDLGEIISDSTMYYFEGNDFAGIDEYGRKYSIVWLPVAVYNEAIKTWTYYGSNSTSQKYIGWYYSVEWYNSNGVKVAADTVRVNLSNEDCHTALTPYYVAEVKSTLSSLEESCTWGNM